MLESELSRRSSEFRSQIAPVTLDRVRNALPADTALIEWFRFLPTRPTGQIDVAQQGLAPHYAAYILKRDGELAAVDLGEVSAIDSLVAKFRMAVSNPRNDYPQQESALLTQKLFGSLLGHVRGTRHLLLAPDGALDLIPMSALGDEKGKYLISQFEISYLTSARDLLRMSAKAKSQKAYVIAADPDFGSSAITTADQPRQSDRIRSLDLDRSGLIFRPLDDTKIEAKGLNDLLGPQFTTLWLGAAATEANLKHLRNPQILHIATHGFFLTDQELSGALQRRGGTNVAIRVAENPLLRSGIALAGANARRSGVTDDGILTALEAAQLELHGTELVVLSACDTGVGDVQNGEGVYGLRRALVLAGAQTQVTSLWKVSDEATRTLMVDFYGRMLKGEGRAAALRHAQLDMLDNSEHSHPYYWASFIPIGNWTPLTARH